MCSFLRASPLHDVDVDFGDFDEAGLFLQGLLHFLDVHHHRKKVGRPFELVSLLDVNVLVQNAVVVVKVELGEFYVRQVNLEGLPEMLAGVWQLEPH